MDAGTDPGPLKAYQLVMAFAARRGEAALRLALHAALPQVLRADLLHLMRLNFLPETVRELAVEADVLFAPFCEDLGNGYYRFAANARLQLLQGLDPAYRGETTARSVQVARFMLDYLDHEQRNVRAGSNRVHADWIEVERWSALGFVDPSLAATQLAAALAQATADADIAARVRVAGLASTLATPLARFGDLLAYAAGVEALEMGRIEEAGRVLGGMADREVEVAGIRLQSPRQVLAGRAPHVEVALNGVGASAQAQTPEQGSETPFEPEEAPTAGAEPPAGDAETPTRNQVYISYSHRDQKWLERLMAQLKTVAGAVGMSNWSDARIGLGEDMQREIAAAIARARVAVVLLSPDYLGSDFLMRRELPQLMERAQSGDLRLTWLCVRPCDWATSPLARFQAAYDPSTALAGLSPARRDRALAEVTKSVAVRLAPGLFSGTELSHPGLIPTESPVIYIVYRRDDAAFHASRLRVGLRSRLGARKVFIEFADVLPGDDPHRTIGAAFGSAAAVLVVIGPQWLESRDAEGQRQLDDPDDAIRMGIAIALQTSVPVVPVLVGSASLPAADLLPEDLLRLTQFNAIALRDAEWDEDCDRLARDLAGYLPALQGGVAAAAQEERPAKPPARICLFTATDLGPERQAAAEALRRMGHEVVGGEFYGAFDTKPLSVAYKEIAESDAVVCILAWRYGFIPPDPSENPERLSFVELEYRQARRLNKTVFAFLVADDAKWDPKAMDAVTGEGEQGQRIIALRQRLASESMTAYFGSVEELSEKLIAVVVLWDQSGRRLVATQEQPDEAAAADAAAAQSPQQAPTATTGLEVLSGGTWMSSTVPASQLSPGTIFRDGSDCPEMVVIPAGEFMMGSPEEDADRPESETPEHKVTFADSFAVGRFAVTFDDWDACVAVGGYGYEPKDEGWGRGRRPVINVSWEDAQTYVTWLSIRTGQSYRLLSEAEWEYAARARTTTRYPWGDEVGTNRANSVNSGSQWSGRQTAPVGSLAPNGFGLFDIIGNVWEWTQDCWNEGYYGAPVSGQPWELGDCGRRVLRGGSWSDNPEYCRSAIRGRGVPGLRLNSLGFRLARTLQVSES